MLKTMPMCTKPLTLIFIFGSGTDPISLLILLLCLWGWCSSKKPTALSF